MDLGVWSETVVLYRWNPFYKSNNDLHSMIGGFMLRGEMDLTSINLTRWTRHETAEHRCPLSYNVSLSILLTCT